jgi:Tol biopolymer transport system component
VAFGSAANNLVPDDTNNQQDVFLHDRFTGQTRRVSVASDGTQGNGDSLIAAISADGRFVAFMSAADNLVEQDSNTVEDVFLHDTQTGETRRISLSSDGTQGNDSSSDPALSADGRFVAFYSLASNLVADDTNSHWDVFLHDTLTGQTNRVSVASDGAQGNADSYYPAISDDGRFIAFMSYADNLAPEDTNAKADILLHDALTGQTTPVSVDSNGVQGNGDSYLPAISADGRFVGFPSLADNLVSGDTNGVTDVFLHDTQTGMISRVSVDSGGFQSNEYSYELAISADGRFVAFRSFASNLVPDDTNGTHDVFLHDMQTGQTSRVSVDSGGGQSNQMSMDPAISADGSLVAFWSLASNLVPGDTNGHRDVFLHGPTPVRILIPFIRR